MRAVTYDLRAEDGSSSEYYADVRSFAHELVTRIEERAGSTLDRFVAHAREREAPRTRIEHAVELLTLGVLYRRYSTAATCASPRLVRALARMHRMRREHPSRKAWLDPARGFLAGILLATKIEGDVGPAPVSLSSFERLLEWLEATGEFHDETRRLALWLSFFREDAETPKRSCLASALELSAWFEGAAAWRLGRYTAGVEAFLREQHPRYRFREDAVFCGRSEVEYHLNMVGAELLNEAFEGEYLRTSRRAVLVPGCMRMHDDDVCQARHDGDDIACTHCDPDCRVSQLTALGTKNGFAVRVILHASTFKKALTPWQGTDTGLVASACLLNLVAGGYQMRELGLPAQCVPLDFSGCRRHWDREGIPTGLSEDKLIELVHKGKAEPPARGTHRPPSLSLVHGSHGAGGSSSGCVSACSRAAACAGRGA